MDIVKGSHSASANELSQRIASREAIVGIIGMGYVGMPLALTALDVGFRVIGFDINENRVAGLNKGESGIKHIASAPLAQAVQDARFRATADLGELGQADVILIAVPTPLSRQREPDLSFVENSARAIARTLRRGQLVVLESTTWPGTTREVLLPILEASGLEAGRDFFLAYSPERENPGDPSFSTSTIPKVVGADDAASLALAHGIYGCLVETAVPLSNSATAEAVKLTENIFRSVNIALVNELKLIFDKMDIDIWEVIEAAKTKPFGYMPFYPGPGLGGHCIPIDPFYLTWKAREFEIATRFVELAGEINTQMPHYVVANLAEALDRNSSRGLNQAHILIIGLAYKKNIDDARESPALKLIELLEARGARTDYHDPFIPEIPSTREHAHLQGRMSVEIAPETVSRYDAVLIATDHDTIDWRLVCRHAKLVVDTRNVCERFGVTGPNVVKS